LPATGAIKSTYTSPILLEFLSGALIGAGWARGWRLGLGASVGLIALGICFLALCDYTAQLPSQLFGAALIVIGSLNATLGMLKSRPLLLLGDASYSIYLSHAFTLLAVKLVWTHVSHSTSVTTAIAFMGFALIASALGGIIVYGVVEGPVTRWFSAKLKRTAKIGPSTEAMPA
jgi:exopolysaccharide production protein ExoZ